MPVGIGAGGSVGLAFESTVGTYVAPTIFVPVLSENLQYQESKYYSRQIRQQTIESDVKSAYYHVAGPISLEVDPNNIPYWLYASRHAITKSAGPPYTYDFVPSSAGSATTAASGAVPRTLSITVVRSGVVFGYCGCIVSSWEFTIQDAVLICNMEIMGLSEAVQSDPTESWLAPELYGADAHMVEVGASAVSPTFSPATDFNGFTFRAGYNAEPRNNIVQARKASYIRYGITEGTIESELDFSSRTDYDNMVNNSTRAIRFSSLNGGATLAAATSGVQLQANRVSYDTYEVSLGSMEDLVVAGFTGRIIGITGGDAYKISVKTTVNIA